MTASKLGRSGIWAAALALAACAAAPSDSPSEGGGNSGGGGLGSPPPALAGGSGGSAGSTPARAGSGGATVVPTLPPPAGSGGSGGAAGAMLTGGSGGMAGTLALAGSGGMAGAVGGSGGVAGMPTDSGTCCPDGNCLCHGPDPTALTAEDGPYQTDSYSITGVGCVYYPTDAEPPFAAVSISDGFLGSGGCGSFQTGAWGPLYASHGIVAMIVNTGSSDQPAARGRALSEGIAAFKAENEEMGSPLFGKLAGRYGTSGFSMGGGGTTYAAQDDPTLLTNVAIMPWGPVNSGVTVPTLIICGASDGTASCTSHGTPAYNGIADSVPKMRVVVSGGHNGQPSAGGGESGRFGLAFQKLFLEGDERWRALLVASDAEESTVQ